MNQQEPWHRDGMHPDDVFDPLATLVSAWMAGVPEAAVEFDGALEVSELAIDIPMELQLLHASDGELGVDGTYAGDKLQIHASPPTQKIATTIMPVWHRLAVRYVAED